MCTVSGVQAVDVFQKHGILQAQENWCIELKPSVVQ